MSKRDRRDSDGRDRDRRDGDRRDWQDEDGQQRRTGEGDMQEGDSLAALKAILSKVASQLKPLNLSADEAIRLVEQLYGSVLEMDSAMAGEADDTRKSSTLAYIQNTAIRREGDRLVVDFPAPEELQAARNPAREAAATAGAGQQASAQEPLTSLREAPVREAAVHAGGEAPPARPPRGGRPRQTPRKERSEAGARSSEQATGDLPERPPVGDPVARGEAERPELEGPEA